MTFFKEEDADIFCLGETKMQPEQADFSFEGYYPYWNSAEKKGYSGVAVFTKHQPLSVAYGLGIDEHDHEGRVLTLEFESFYLVNVYVPNSQNELGTPGLPNESGRMTFEPMSVRSTRKNRW